MTISRRTFLASSLMTLATTGALRATGAGTPFTHDDVIQRAADLAGMKYRPRPMVPQAWQDLTYEEYRLIRFRPEASLWKQSQTPFNVDFFAPGLYFPRAVKVHTVEQGMARPVAFDPAMFEHSERVPDLPIDRNMGFSGLRLRAEMHRPGKKDEFVVFQGASYFRAIGLNEVYGLSARGLALGTGEAEGEEFPDFVEFWLGRPAPDDPHMVVHALLDSPSVAGAYQFKITPGVNCEMEVAATLFPRVELDHAGIAPLTSMFLFDAKDRTRFQDFRPAVHDSDGLMIRNGAGEALWRPLNNPRTLQVSSFVDTTPQGFGLMQRPRNFSDYNDLEALYHKRPGLWVEPMGDWGKGAVTLVEIPADREIYDNIVAYWRPAKPVPAGERLDLAYRLSWGDTPPVAPGLPQVVKTAMGNGWKAGKVAVIDFEPHEIFADGPQGFDIHTSSPHVETTDGVLQRNPETGGLRLAFGFDPGERQAVELRAQLRKDGGPASEVWLYRWTA